MKAFLILFTFTYLLFSSVVLNGTSAEGLSSEEDVTTTGNLDVDLDVDSGSGSGPGSDDQVVKGEEKAIQLDGINPTQMEELREKSQKFQFQAEVNRTMKIIINSVYKNKEIFMRELISNSVDALRKVEFQSLTNTSILGNLTDLTIRIKSDESTNMLHITDTGVGMTKAELETNLGMIANSGTAKFVAKHQEQSEIDSNEMIGQFGVGFYSVFLVADRVLVSSKHPNESKSYIWESDSNSFSIVEDPRANTVHRGTTVSLQLKPEAKEYLDSANLRDLIKRYSQFVKYPIYLWASRTEEVEEPIKTDDAIPEDDNSDGDNTDKDDEAAVEEDKDDESVAQKTKKVDKTVWTWQKVNDKPLWTKEPQNVTDEEYNQFYKDLTTDSMDPLSKVHFSTEGEVPFKSILFVPTVQASEHLNRHGTHTNNIKLYVKRVFVTNDVDLMPQYLNFIKGLVDIDDLPLNVSREMLQQNNILKIIKRKLIRKILEMLRKLSTEVYTKFWKEFSTNMKLGCLEDAANRNRLVKLLMFHSSKSEANKMTFLSDYVARMKPKQEHIYYMAGPSLDEVKQSPFVERLQRKGYEVLYLVEAIDEYAISSHPDFGGKKFQNVAKEGFSLPDVDGGKEDFEAAKKSFEPLVKWLSDTALKNRIAKATVSERLTKSPCALVASMFGWTGNMERLAISNAHQKADDVQKSYYLNQKKTLEINPKHPLIKALLERVTNSATDPIAKEMTMVLFNTATLRSGYMLQEPQEFAQAIDAMLLKTLGVYIDESTEDDDNFVDESESALAQEINSSKDTDEHDEL